MHLRSAGCCTELLPKSWTWHHPSNLVETQGEDILMFVLPCFDVVVHKWYLTDGLQQPFLLVAGLLHPPRSKVGGHHSPSWSSSKLWLLCLLSFCPCMAKMLTITCAWWGECPIYECLQPNIWQYTLDVLTMVETLLDTRDAPYKFHTVHGLLRFVGLRPSWKAKWTFKPTIQIFGTIFARHILARMTKDTPRHKCAELWAKQSVLSANWWRQRVKVDKQTKWLSSSVSQSPTLNHRSSRCL